MLQLLQLLARERPFDPRMARPRHVDKVLAEQALHAHLFAEFFELLGQARGMNTLLRADDVLGAYAGMCGVTRRSWARDNEKAVVGFTRAYWRAVQWMTAPDNRAWAEALLIAHVSNLTPALAPKAANILLAEKGGFKRDLSLDEAGVRTVLALRSKYGQPQRELTDPTRYIDLRYRSMALAAS